MEPAPVEESAKAGPVQLAEVNYTGPSANFSASNPREINPAPDDVSRVTTLGEVLYVPTSATPPTIFPVESTITSQP